MKNEIALFKQLEKRESEESEQTIRGGFTISRPDLLPRTTHAIMREIDLLVRRHFCLYSEDAKTRGFGYQSYLMETEIVPHIEKEIEQLQSVKTSAIAQMPKSAQGTTRSWKEQAAAAGLNEQFQFVYSYTSRLLHATPTSLTTNQKNLEWDEIVMFLDFLYVSMLDAIEMAQLLAGLKEHDAN